MSLLEWKKRDKSFTATIQHPAGGCSPETETTFVVERDTHFGAPVWKLSWGYGFYYFKGKTAAQEYAESCARIRVAR